MSERALRKMKKRERWSPKRGMRVGDGCWLCVGRPRRLTAADRRRLDAAKAEA